MNDPQTLRAKAASVLGATEPLEAVGIFGLQSNYLALTAGGVVGSTVGGELGNLAGMHAARELDAASKGVSVRMLVAVTATHIQVLDWVTGSGPTRLMCSFNRVDTSVEIKKFGLSRRLNLHDRQSGESIGLTGSTSPMSAYAKADKAVLAALA